MLTRIHVPFVGKIFCDFHGQHGMISREVANYRIGNLLVRTNQDSYRMWLIEHFNFHPQDQSNDRHFAYLNDSWVGYEDDQHVTSTLAKPQALGIRNNIWRISLSPSRIYTKIRVSYRYYYIMHEY